MQSRHERVCAKNQQITKKRPVFDTAKKRMEGTDLQAFHASRPHLKTRKPSTAEIVSSTLTIIATVVHVQSPDAHSLIMYIHVCVVLCTDIHVPSSPSLGNQGSER